MTNLVTNAIQYTPAGGKVTSSMIEEHNDVVIAEESKIGDRVLKHYFATMANSNFKSQNSLCI